MLQFQRVNELDGLHLVQNENVPEGHGPHCRQRARLLAPYATAVNHTLCTCVVEPLTPFFSNPSFYSLIGIGQGRDTLLCRIVWLQRGSADARWKRSWTRIRLWRWRDS